MHQVGHRPDLPPHAQLALSRELRHQLRQGRNARRDLPPSAELPSSSSNHETLAWLGTPMPRCRAVPSVRAEHYAASTGEVGPGPQRPRPWVASRRRNVCRLGTRYRERLGAVSGRTPFPVPSCIDWRETHEPARHVEDAASAQQHGRDSLTTEELRDAAVDCYSDTLLDLRGAGAVASTHDGPTQHSKLSDSACKVLNVCTVACRLEGADEVQVDRKRVFCIMPFGQPWSDKLWACCRAAAKDAGFNVSEDGTDDDVKRGDTTLRTGGA